MNAESIQQELIGYTIQHSGAEQRAYLGMSAISECPLELYRRLTSVREWTPAMHLNCYSGYLWERDVKARLEALGLYRPGSERELVARFDKRFIGHTDGEIVTGELLEIKSTRQDRLDRIKIERRIPTANFEQVQVYLRHGNYQRAHIVYVARDTGSIHVAEVRAIPDIADRLDTKAKSILQAADRHQPPRCECRRCKMPSALEPLDS